MTGIILYILYQLAVVAELVYAHVSGTCGVTRVGSSPTDGTTKALQGVFCYSTVMNYLYHAVPKLISGDTLYPLNELKGRLPEVFQHEFSKYANRPHIVAQHIPILDCAWNDVLHFSAVHPQDIKDAISEAGGQFPNQREYFQIDPEMLNPAKTIVYLHQKDPEHFQDDFVAYSPTDIAQYSILPDQTRQYYSKLFALGKKPLWYAFVPHILFRGAIDIGNINKITV